LISFPSRIGEGGDYRRTRRIIKGRVMARLANRMNHSQSSTHRIIERTPVTRRRPTCLSRKTNTHILRWRRERKRKKTCNPHQFRQHQQTIQHPPNEYHFWFIHFRSDSSQPRGEFALHGGEEYHPGVAWSDFQIKKAHRRDFENDRRSLDVEHMASQPPNYLNLLCVAFRVFNCTWPCPHNRVKPTNRGSRITASVSRANPEPLIGRINCSASNATAIRADHIPAESGRSQHVMTDFSRANAIIFLKTNAFPSFLSPTLSTRSWAP